MFAMKGSPLKAKEGTANRTDGWLGFTIQLEKTFRFTKSTFSL